MAVHTGYEISYNLSGEDLITVTLLKGSEVLAVTNINLRGVTNAQKKSNLRTDANTWARNLVLVDKALDNISTEVNDEDV